MVNSIEKLAENPKNTIFIITEFDSYTVEKHLGHIKNLILVTNGGILIIIKY